MNLAMIPPLEVAKYLIKRNAKKYKLVFAYPKEMKNNENKYEINVYDLNDKFLGKVLVINGKVTVQRFA